MKVKAGYKTSEFWFTLVSFIFSGLYLTGILTENDQKEELITVVSHAVESCILIGGQLLILYKYVKGRNEIKKTWSNNQIDTIPKENKNDTVIKEKKSNGHSRKSKKQTTRASKKQPKKSR